MLSFINAQRARAVIFAFLLGFGLTGPLPACGAVAAVVSVLPSVIKLLTDSMLVLDTIHDYVDTYEQLSPGAKADIHSAIEDARIAFDAVKNVAKTAKSFDDKDFVAALKSARDAYDNVLALCDRHGVKVTATDSRLFGTIEAQGLVVPTFDRLKSDSL